MKKILIFGAGEYGQRVAQYLLRTKDELIGFTDNNVRIHGKRIRISDGENTDKSFLVYAPEELDKLSVDIIIISNNQRDQINAIKQQLKELNHKDTIQIEVLKDNKELYKNVFTYSTPYDEYKDKRISFMRDLALYLQEENVQGNVAECGVWLGDFSYFINKYFPEKTLYLFDTFEGFDERDLEVEHSIGDVRFENGYFVQSDSQFRPTSDSIEIIKGKLPHVEKSVFKKGYFPESANGVNDTFCFVNLDMDLYQPMYAGLKFFYDKMAVQGVLLLHDYFHKDLPGVKKAVEDYENKRGQKLVKVPIGDGCSIAIIKV